MDFIFGDGVRDRFLRFYAVRNSSYWLLASLRRLEAAGSAVQGCFGLVPQPSNSQSCSCPMSHIRAVQSSTVSSSIFIRVHLDTTTRSEQTDPSPQPSPLRKGRGRT